MSQAQHESQATERLSYEQAKQMLKDGEELRQAHYVAFCEYVWKDIVEDDGDANGKPRKFNNALAKLLEDLAPELTRFYSFVQQPAGGPPVQDWDARGCRLDSDGRPLVFVSDWREKRRLFNAAF